MNTCHRPVILLVDDEPFIRMAAMDMLTACGAEVLEASIAEGSLLEHLDDRVDRLAACVRDAVFEVGQDVWQVALHHRGDLLHRGESRAHGPAVPALVPARRHP